MNIVLKCIVVLLLTAVVTGGAVFMIGPQIMIIVPAAIVAGMVFAVRRCFLSLVCFGYPFTFGWLSALIGCAEITDYRQTTAFAVSAVIGSVGIALIATGLWKALSSRSARAASGVAEQSPAGDSLEAAPEE
jgi:Na+-transporting NADH:ubiquinone oxidoreductase subunit NqrE